MSHNPNDPDIHDAAWQVSYLKNLKGLSFDLTSEQDAAAFLEDMTFFFKIKAFAKNFEKRRDDGPDQGKYINLDFGHLVELSRLDVHVRSTALSLSLDVEHYLKVRINRSAMRCGVNPCALTEGYLNHAAQTICSDIAKDYCGNSSEPAIDGAIRALEKAGDSPTEDDAIAQINRAVDLLESITGGRRPDYIFQSMKARGSSSYSRDLLAKYDYRKMPYWAFMELISFGPLIKLYKFCFRKNGYVPDAAEAHVAKRAMNLLRNTQSLRNASAHGDCLMNGLSKHSKNASRGGVKRSVIECGMDPEVVNPVGSVPLAMDFAALLLCYDLIVLSCRSKEAAAGRLSCLSEKLLRHRDWFAANQPVRAFLDYMEALLDLFANRWS